MVFNNFYFLFLFFPIFYVIYIYFHKTAGNFLILAASIIFYTIGVWKDPKQLGLLLAITAVGTFGCLLFQQRKFCKRIILALFIVTTAAPLVYVKLAGLFLADSPDLPLGLSFYTFQTIAFLVYSYRHGTVNAIGVINGILFFPKLLSGPIAEPEKMIDEMQRIKLRRHMIDRGLQEFVIGLGYKVILADHLIGALGKVRIRGVEGVSVRLAWLGLLCYALQLYFDFCGFSRMAVGIAAMMGIRLPHNFEFPYCSRSVREFWRRWHITLGNWFKNYVYIPLGGSQHGTPALVFSTLAVWLLTGLWHGAGWNYILWGLMMFGLLMGERFLWGKWLDRYPLIGHIYLPFLIMLSWIFFITKDPAEAGHYFLRLIGVTRLAFDPDDWRSVLSQCWMCLLAGLVWATPIPQILFQKISKKLGGWILMGVLFVVCLYFMSTEAFEPFLYFSF